MMLMMTLVSVAIGTATASVIFVVIYMDSIGDSILYLKKVWNECRGRNYKRKKKVNSIFFI